MEWTPELKHAAEYQMPEAAVAMGLRGYADEHLGQQFRIDQEKLDEMTELGMFRPTYPAYTGARIDRLCLHFRFFCLCDPGGERGPALGVTEWGNLRRAETSYGVFRFSPENDWLEIAAFSPTRGKVFGARLRGAFRRWLQRIRPNRSRVRWNTDYELKGPNQAMKLTATTVRLLGLLR